jgi:hypothetical protein
MVCWFLTELSLLNFEKNGNFQFPFIISVRVVRIKFKFDIWIHHRITQVKFEFGRGPMIFYRVIFVEEIFSLRYLTFVCIYVLAGLKLPIAFIAFCDSLENFATGIQKMQQDISYK